MKKTDTITSSGLKTVYLDVMLSDGTFCRQVPYRYCPLFPIDTKKLRAYVLGKCPSLANKKIKIQFSNNRVL